jgi:hypothetical protein
MKRLFAIYCAAILICATGAYASIPSMYTYDCANSLSWRSGSYIRFACGNFVGANVRSYHLNDGRPDQVALIAQAGLHLTPDNLNSFLATTSDGSGWIYRGNGFWVSKSGRMDALLTWASGYHIMNVRYVNSVQSKPKAHSKPKRKPQELLPPVQEQD